MKKNLVNLLAFVGFLIIAVLELFNFFTLHDILKIEGGTVMSVLNTIKNICIILVIGISAGAFVKGKQKGIVIIYIIAMIIIILTTIFLWIKF